MFGPRSRLLSGPIIDWRAPAEGELIVEKSTEFLELVDNKEAQKYRLRDSKDIPKLKQNETFSWDSRTGVL
ncbi:unnamed protein product [Dovyalis caffra]|uniref:Uncharacterized protein n=1 Tax=Dovyalis caffra TaxID=77055 RepID=A0AAV1SFX7_9ROSI|nr:unnamed protein product [Dovyalis caffra]